jgi:hypothetical protein
MQRSQACRRAGRSQAWTFPMVLPPTSPSHSMPRCSAGTAMLLPLGKPLASSPPSPPHAVSLSLPIPCAALAAAHMPHATCHMAHGTLQLIVPPVAQQPPIRCTQSICLPDAEFREEHAWHKKSGFHDVVSTPKSILSCQGALEHGVTHGHSKEQHCRCHRG